MKSLIRYWPGVALALACGFAFAASPSSPPAGNLVFEAVSETPVEIFQGADARFTYRVRNTGTSPIRIQRIDPAPPPGSARFEPAELAPGATGRIELEKPAIDALGKQSFAFHVYSTDAAARSVPVSLPVFVGSAYVPELPAIDFGVIRKGHAEPKLLEVTSFEAPSLKMEGIIEKPDWVLVEPVPGETGKDPQRLMLRVSLTKNLPLGESRRTVKIRTNIQTQPVLVLQVATNAYDKIQVSPAQMDIGAIHRNAKIVQTVDLRAIDGKPIQITKAEETGENLDLSIEPCGEGCARLSAKVKTANLKPLRGYVTVQVGSHGETIKIPYYGLIVKEGTMIKNLGVLDANADVRVQGEVKEQ
ncbi:hypothetical protein [Dokdonella koreensis]|nr:hypothetical protein [Dokdonella koreensis]